MYFSYWLIKTVLFAQVVLGGGSMGSGSAGGPGAAVPAASFTSTASEACPDNPYDSLEEDVNGDGTAWRCYAIVKGAMTKD